MDTADKLDLETKWKLVYNHEQIQWQEERRNATQAKRATMQGQLPSTSLSKDSPEWYLKKFVDQTITSKQCVSLVVSLRTLPVE